MKHAVSKILSVKSTRHYAHVESIGLDGITNHRFSVYGEPIATPGDIVVHRAFSQHSDSPRTYIYNLTTDLYKCHPSALSAQAIAFGVIASLAAIGTLFIGEAILVAIVVAVAVACFGVALLVERKHRSRRRELLADGKLAMTQYSKEIEASRERRKQMVAA